MTHRFNPAKMDRLLAEDRRAWNDPEQILPHLGLSDSTIMADIGCGPGWFTIEAARKMQPGGLVYGIDVSAEMLARLQERAQEAGLSNVQAVFAEDEAEYPIPSESCDVLLIANVYHEIDPASLFLSEVKRILKPGCTCLIVDWKKEPTPMGPPLEARVDPQDVTEELNAAGFSLVGTCDVGPHHYGLKFAKLAGAEAPEGGLDEMVP